MNEKPRRLIQLFYLVPIILLIWIILHFVFPIQMIIVFPLTLIGLAPIIVGFYINLKATKTLTNGTTFDADVNPRTLVTEGFFQYSRNPMYLGGIVALFGLAILLGSLVSFVVLAVCFLLMHFLYIPEEEAQLKTMFGEEYFNYMKRVRKWI